MKLIDNRNWGKEIADGRRRGHSNSRKQESSGEDIIGSHVHGNDKDSRNETETMKHVMATVGLTGIEHQIRNEEEFDDEIIGEVVGSITTVTDRLPNIPEQDQYELNDNTASIYDDIRNLKDRGGGMSISKRLEIGCGYFTGGAMAHSLGCDFHPLPYPQEEREHARRIKHGPSPNSKSLVSLKIILHRLVILVGREYNTAQMEDDLNRIGIACVTDLYNMMTKNRGDDEYDIIIKKYV